MPLGGVFDQFERFAQLVVFARIGFAAGADIFVFVFFAVFGFGLLGGFFRFFGLLLQDAAFDFVGAGGVVDVAGEVGFAALEGAVFILHFHIRQDAGGLDRAVFGRVVERGGDFQRAAVAHRDHRLHRAFAEAAGADQYRTAVILQRAGHDFGSRCGTGVDQNGHRHGFDFRRQVFERVAARGEQIVFGTGFEFHRRAVVAAFGADHQQIGLQEGCRYADRAVEQAAGVVAQIKNHAFERAFVFFGKRGNRFGQRRHGALLELADTHIAVAVFQQVVAHAFHFDHGAGDVDHNRLGAVFARQGQGDFGTGFAAHFFHRVGNAHAACGFVVDFDDEVAAFYAGTLGGRVFNRRDHFDKAVFRADFHAQAAEFAAGALLHVGIAFFVHIFGVRIKAGNHAFDGVFDQFFVFFVAHVIGFHLTVNFGHIAQGRDRQPFFFLGGLIGGDRLGADRQHGAG